MRLIHANVRGCCRLVAPGYIASASGTPERVTAQKASQQQQKWLKYSQRGYCVNLAEDFTLEIAWKDFDDAVLAVPQRQWEQLRHLLNSKLFNTMVREEFITAGLYTFC